MFGGLGDTAELGDTWEWDGVTWNERTPASSPSPREAHAMAYDPLRQRLVLFGGIAGSGVLGDTWEWDGTSWAERTPAHSPQPRYSAGMTYDPQRERIVLFGGAGFAVYQDTWEWDGTDWVVLAPQEPAPTRAYVNVAYDAVEHRLLFFGGYAWNGDSTDETWALQWQAPFVASERCLVSTEDDDGDGLAGCADPDCWARCSPACPPGMSCPTSSPECGDAICEPIEDPRICPSDCPML
jgi:hypothetical protein